MMPPKGGSACGNQTLLVTDNAIVLYCVLFFCNVFLVDANFVILCVHNDAMVLDCPKNFKKNSLQNFGEEENEELFRGIL